MSDIIELERGVSHARDNLMRTLDEVNRKATATAQELFLPEQPIRRYPVASVCGAMALGFAAGGWRTPAVLLGVLAIGSAFSAD
jgi:fatty acid desaturase